MTDWTNEEEEAFNDVERNSNLGKRILKDIGQPYHFEVFVSVSQRNQVLEEVAKVFDERDKDIGWYDPGEPAQIIRGMKK
jgi:hypothetical protein